MCEGAKMNNKSIAKEKSKEEQRSGHHLGVWESSLEDRANFISKLFINYLTPFLRLGSKKVLDASDVGVPSHVDKAEPCYEKTRFVWEEEIAKAKKKNELHQAAYEAELAKCTTDEQRRKVKKPKKVEPKLTSVLVRSFGAWQFYVGIFCYAISAVLTFAPVLLLEDLVKFFQAGASTDNYQGYAHPWVEVCGLAIFPLLIALFQTRNQVIMGHAGTFVRTVVSLMLFHKALRVSAAGRAKTSTGQVVNMMSNDTQQLQRVLLFAGMTFIAPFQIIAALTLIYYQVGHATWVGLAFMIGLAPINVKFFAYASKMRREALKYSDMRVKIMNEILSGIRIIKFYAWERPFRQEVETIRSKEVNALTKLAYVTSVGVSLVLSSVPLVQPVLVFGTYMWIEDRPLDAATAFTTIALFNMMRIPFAFLPLGLLQFLQGKIAIQRLEKYFSLPELPDYVESTAPPDSDVGSKVGDITIRGSFSWVDPDELNETASDDNNTIQLSAHSNTNIEAELKEKKSVKTLKDLNVTFNAGSVIACVGSVGSGKSSLLSAILGEMEPIDGAKVYIPRAEGQENNSHFVSYCTQTPWVLNDTLRDNILFGREYDEGRYNEVLAACALLDDIAVLPAGDMTEIGERGINLSGGQKARVSLARALYSKDTQIILMDDPLSAVDAHVGEHLFSEAVKGDVAKNATRVIVTHHVHVLRRCDSVVVMEEGRVKHFGKYQDLIDQGVDFAGAVDSEKKDEKDEKEENEGEAEVAESSEAAAADKPSEAGDDKMKKAGEKLTSDEDREEGSVDGSAYIKYAKAGGIIVAFCMLVMQGVSKGADVLNNFWLARWADETTEVLIRGERMTAADTRYYLGIYALFGFMGVCGITLQGLIIAFHRLRASKRLHHDLTVSVLRAPVAFFDVTPTGRILNRFASDMDKVDLELTQSLSHGLGTIFSIMAALVAITVATKGSFFVMLVPLGIIYFMIQKWFRKTSTNLQRLNSVANSPIFADFSQTLFGTSTIRAYGEEERFSNKCKTSFDTMNASYVLIQLAFSWLAIRLDVLGGLVGAFIGGVALATSSRSFIPAGWVGLALSYSIEVTGYLKHGVRTIATLEAQMSSVERIYYYSTNIEPEAPEEVPEKDPPANEWPSKGEIEFSGASMRYRDGPLVLKNISLKVKAGEKIGVCGRTGSGKSSLMITLFRITELESDGGKILIDGVDTSQIGTTVLRRGLSIIPQDPTMFSNTIRYNLDPFGTSTEAEMWNVLEKVNLDTFVGGLPQRLDENMSEGGENFSQGQRQLICIARALLQKPKILVMDEATASIDNATDALIQKMIRENFKDATVLTIAHRLNTIMDSDRVLVLDDGKIAEFDTPSNLLKKENGHFKSMVEKSQTAKDKH